MKIIEKLTTTILVIVMTVNTFMVIRIWVLVNTDEKVMQEKKSSYILPEGYTPKKTIITWNDSSSSPSGWVVRYANQGCMYCKLDFEWERLASELDRHNYRTILVLPLNENQYDEDNVIPKTAKQMAFVKTEWIKQFSFRGTPTVVIFDNNGRMIWHRNGMLTEIDYNSAIKAIVNK